MVNFSKYISTEEAASTFVDAEIRNGATYMRSREVMNVRLLPSSAYAIECSSRASV
jgi:hypothetical protein